MAGSVGVLTMCAHTTRTTYKRMDKKTVDALMSVILGIVVVVFAFVMGQTLRQTRDMQEVTLKLTLCHVQGGYPTLTFGYSDVRQLTPQSINCQFGE